MDKDFGLIFSTLLPGARARLEPCKTGNALTGLEFRIALGNTWKENLTELSGGQRWVNFVGFLFVSFANCSVYN